MRVRERLDVALVRQGLAASRAEAKIAIEAGLVRVGGRPAAKAATLVARDESLTVSGPPRRFVSRGGEKLDAALQRFGVEAIGVDCLDAGASTGGFTDCLLQRGAARVIAADVGYGQLDWSLRQDPRVVVIERTNVRSLVPADLPFAPTLVVADLSFISLRTVLPALAAVSSPHAQMVLLVKPQFEVGPGHVGKGGVVRDPEAWRRGIHGVALGVQDQGFTVQGLMVSPLLGPAGNVEFCLCAQRDAPPATAVVDLAAALDEALDDGRLLREGA